MTRNPSRRPRRYTAAAAAGSAALLLASACSGGGGGTDVEADTEGVDDGTTLTMWTRAATEAQSQALVDEYNATHDNKVELTVIPTDDYQTRVGTAAGNQELPDLFAIDVVFAPNFTQAGAYLDLTEYIDSLDYADALAPSHIEVGTVEDSKYLVPHTMDLSVLIYNKDLYEQAGLDPEQPPTTMSEYAEHARAIDELGDDVYGTYFGGNCGGCNVFALWPTLWAEGVEVMNEDGTESNLATPEAQQLYEIWNGLTADGIAAPGYEEETGVTWISRFADDDIGIHYMGSSALVTLPEDLNYGLAPIPGLTGGNSTFVGGDSIGIAANSEHPNQAWDFLRWSLEEETQVGVVAANDGVMARTDLSDSEVTADDPTAAMLSELIAIGRTPNSVNFGQTFNDPQGPWLPLLRGAVLDGNADVDALNEDITASLSG